MKKDESKVSEEKNTTKTEENKVEESDLIDLHLEKEGNFNKKFNTYAKRVFNKRDIFLLPNVLCYFRILVSIAYAILYLWPNDFVSGDPLNGTNFLFNSTLCGLLILLCGYTDFVDGFLARKLKQQSHLGKIFDPLADKLLQLAIGISFVVKITYFHPNWDYFFLVYIMFGIFVIKEGTLFFFNLYFISKNTELKGPIFFGKATTFIFYVDMGLLLVFYHYFLETKLYWLITMMVCIPLVLFLITYIIYFFEFASLKKKIKRHEANQKIEEQNNIAVTNIVKEEKVVLRKDEDSSSTNENLK